jgi:hypothetical protein
MSNFDGNGKCTSKLPLAEFVITAPSCILIKLKKKQIVVRLKNLSMQLK